MKKKLGNVIEQVGTKYDLNQELKVASDYKEVKIKSKFLMDVNGCSWMLMSGCISMYGEVW